MGNPERENPQETELAGEVSRGSDGARDLPKRVNRYGIARERARQMVDHLAALQQVPDQSGEVAKLHRLLKGCGEYLEFRHYYIVDKVRLTAAQFCRKTLLCPLCAIRRGAKMLKAYLDRYQVIQGENPGLRASLVTLTVQNGPDLAERFDHLRSGVKRLLERRRDYLKKGRGQTEARKWLGLVGTYEVTNKGNGWHPHTHLIVLHYEDLDQAALSREWKSVTGDSFIVDCRPFEHPDDPAQDFVEVFKYAMKFSDLSLADNFYAFQVLKGRRLLYSAGLFRGVEVPEELTDERLEGLPYVELFYRYVHGAGYSLERVSRTSILATPASQS